MHSPFKDRLSSFCLDTCRIAEWVAKQAEREREKEQKKQERLARRRAMPKHTFDDQTYTQHIQQNSERIEDALQQGKTVILIRPFIKTVVNEAGGITNNYPAKSRRISPDT